MSNASPEAGIDGVAALVTGAAGAIGGAIVDALAECGARVALTDIHSSMVAEHAHALRAQGRAAVGLSADVCDAAAVRLALEEAEQELGPLGIAVSVAGVLHAGALVDTADEDWRRTFAVNADGPFHLLRAAARRMRPRGAGAIVVVGSNAARVPRAQMGAYAASKAAAAMLARCAGLELAPHGIRVNVVSPGSTDSAMHEQLWPDGSAAERSIAGSPEQFRVGVPLGRIADPADIAEAVAFLVSDRARHITMHDLVVDGGATLAA